MTPREKTKTAIEVVLEVGNVIKALGEIPSGHLYARLMGKMTLDDYNAIIDTLKQAGVVEESNHMLKWIGK